VRFKFGFLWVLNCDYFYFGFHFIYLCTYVDLFITEPPGYPMKYGLGPQTSWRFLPRLKVVSQSRVKSSQRLPRLKIFRDSVKYYCYFEAPSFTGKWCRNSFSPLEKYLCFMSSQSFSEFFWFLFNSIKKITYKTSCQTFSLQCFYGCVSF
jgi:hypothetical protein